MIVCDICKKELKDYTIIEVKIKDRNPITSRVYMYDIEMELCPSCTKKIVQANGW